MDCFNKDILLWWSRYLVLNTAFKIYKSNNLSTTFINTILSSNIHFSMTVHLKTCLFKIKSLTLFMVAWLRPKDHLLTTSSEESCILMSRGVPFSHCFRGCHPLLLFFFWGCLHFPPQRTFMEKSLRHLILANMGIKCQRRSKHDIVLVKRRSRETSRTSELFLHESMA